MVNSSLCSLMVKLLVSALSICSLFLTRLPDSFREETLMEIGLPTPSPFTQIHTESKVNERQWFPIFLNPSESTELISLPITCYPLRVIFLSFESFL